MQRLQQGMAVFAVEGRRVGIVSEIHLQSNCFEVKREPCDGGLICIGDTALFTAEPREGATLICGKDDLERYRCALHCGPAVESAR